MTKQAFALALVLALMGAGATARPAAAQVSWESPLFVAPSTPVGWGLFLVDPAPGEGVGFMGTWRRDAALGYRIGIAEGPGDEGAFFLGADYSANLVQGDDEFPLDLDWVVGAGVGIGDWVLLSVPVGLTMGRLLEAENLVLNPYFTPRLVVDAFLGDPPGGDDLDLSFAVDVGLDVSPAASWSIRFAGTLGDREALGIGVSVRP